MYPPGHPWHGPGVIYTPSRGYSPITVTYGWNSAWMKHVGSPFFVICLEGKYRDGPRYIHISCSPLHPKEQPMYSKAESISINTT